MARGGARNRSGPTADADSGRSDRRGYTLESLPAEGYRGRVPAYPLERHDFFHRNEDGDVIVDERASRAFRKREIALWRELWRTPQGCAWILPANEWRWRIVANYCRLSVRCETADAPASLLAQLHRFADQIGMTTAGLAEMGWKIAEPVERPATAADSATPAASAPSPGRARDRLKVVPGGRAGA